MNVEPSQLLIAGKLRPQDRHILECFKSQDKILVKDTHTPRYASEHSTQVRINFLLKVGLLRSDGGNPASYTLTVSKEVLLKLLQHSTEHSTRTRQGVVNGRDGRRELNVSGVSRDSQYVDRGLRFHGDLHKYPFSPDGWRVLQADQWSERLGFFKDRELSHPFQNTREMIFRHSLLPCVFRVRVGQKRASFVFGDRAKMVPLLRQAIQHAGLTFDESQVVQIQGMEYEARVPHDVYNDGLEKARYDPRTEKPIYFSKSHRDKGQSKLYESARFLQDAYDYDEKLSRIEERVSTFDERLDRFDKALDKHVDLIEALHRLAESQTKVNTEVLNRLHLSPPSLSLSAPTASAYKVSQKWQAMKEKAMHLRLDSFMEKPERIEHYEEWEKVLRVDAS